MHQITNYLLQHFGQREWRMDKARIHMKEIGFEANEQTSRDFYTWIGVRGNLISTYKIMMFYLIRSLNLVGGPTDEREEV